MAVRPRLDLRQQVRLGLSPQMRQSLAMLRMPAVDLAEMMARMASENPFLILSRRRLSPSGAVYDRAVAMAAAPTGLVENLTHQLRAHLLAPDVRAVAEYLAGELRDDGYLDVDLDEVTEALGLPADLAQAGLAALQACEPVGIGARSLAECLELQLVDRGVARDLAAQVIAALDDIAVGRLAPAARRIGIPVEEMRRIAGLVRGLTPRPVDTESGPTAMLRPDLLVTFGPDGMPAVAFSGELPLLRLDQSLTRKAGDDFAAEGRSEAERFIRAVQQRGETLLRLGQAIVTHQQAFFTEGPDRLRPLRRADLAAELGLHPSTLGRAVAGKALEAQGRIYPLSFFFTLPAPGHRAGEPSLQEELSSFTLRRAIARMIAEEPAEAPLSDAEIADRLSRDGVDIARRTVAKYRDGMKIPSSRRRRRLNGFRRD